MKKNIPGSITRIISGKIGWIVTGFVAIFLVFIFVRQTDSSISPESIELTLRSIPVEGDVYVPTIEANFTRTPRIISLSAAAPTLALSGQRETRQFAASALADSESAATGQTALQVVGPSNVEGCTDSPYAFKPGDSILRVELKVFFAQLVTPTEIIINESFNPGRIVRIDTVDVRGEKRTVFEAASSPTLACPYRRIISIPNADYQTNAIVIIMESSNPYTHTQIDSIELAGISFN